MWPCCLVVRFWFINSNSAYRRDAKNQSPPSFTSTIGGTDLCWLVLSLSRTTHADASHARARSPQKIDQPESNSLPTGFHVCGREPCSRPIPPKKPPSPTRTRRPRWIPARHSRHTQTLLALDPLKHTFKQIITANRLGPCAKLGCEQLSCPIVNAPDCGRALWKADTVYYRPTAGGIDSMCWQPS
jgi:hypothetical protein